MVISIVRLRAIRFPRFRKAPSAGRETPAAVERRLLEKYQRAHRVYAFLRADLDHAPIGMFADLVEQLEEAQEALTTARAALDACRLVQCRPRFLFREEVSGA